MLSTLTLAVAPWWTAYTSLILDFGLGQAEVWNVLHNWAGSLVCSHYCEKSISCIAPESQQEITGQRCPNQTSDPPHEVGLPQQNQPWKQKTHLACYKHWDFEVVIHNSWLISTHMGYAWGICTLPLLCCASVGDRYGNALFQASPTTGARTGAGLWPVRSQVTQQEVSSKQGVTSSVFTGTPHHLNYCLWIILWTAHAGDLDCSSSWTSNTAAIPSFQHHPGKDCFLRNWSWYQKGGECFFIL